MHIYSTEELEKKQNEFIKANIYKPVMLRQYLPITRVIKNYIYYDTPCRIGFNEAQ